MKESEIQKMILQWLELQPNCFAIRTNNIGVPIVDKTRGVVSFRKSPVAGLSDILVCWKGKFLALEVKRPHRSSKVTQAQTIFLENVKNLERHDRGKTFKIIKGALEELGYSFYYKIINAKALVPQNRERIFMIGFKDRTIDFKFPEIPENNPKIKDILLTRIPKKYTLTDHLWNYLQNYAEKHRQRGNGFGYGLVDLNNHSRTLSARYYKDGSEILIPQNGKNPRRLTPRECARLQGFPDHFKIPVSDTQAYKQFGNAVAVPVIEILAKAVVASLRDKPKRNSPYAPQLTLSSYGKGVS